MFKDLKKMEASMLKYFKAHPSYNSFVHFIIGVGSGILITYPFVGTHPLRWGGTVLIVGIFLHLKPILWK